MSFKLLKNASHLDQLIIQSRVFVEKLIITQIIKKFRSYVNLWSTLKGRKNLPLKIMLKQMSPVNILMSYIFKKTLHYPSL
jgi:hypothetical protein